MFLKPTIAKCIVNSFVVSICLGTLAVVQVTFTESTLIASISERGPLATVGGPSPTFRKKFRNESVSGCGFLTKHF